MVCGLAKYKPFAKWSSVTVHFDALSESWIEPRDHYTKNSNLDGREPAKRSVPGMPRTSVRASAHCLYLGLLFSYAACFRSELRSTFLYFNLLVNVTCTLVNYCVAYISVCFPLSLPQVISCIAALSLMSVMHTRAPFSVPTVFEVCRFQSWPHLVEVIRKNVQFFIPLKTNEYMAA